MRRIALFLLLALASSSPAGARQEAYDKLAPFTAMRFEGEQPSVELDGEWWTLVELDGRSSRELVEFAKSRYREKWKKRLSEDLVQVLTEMGRAPKSKVDLVVAGANGKRKKLPGVSMTAANRKRAHDYNELHDEAERETKRGGSRLTKDAMRGDLAELRTLIDERYSYAARRSDAIEAAFAEAESETNGDLAESEFALVLTRLLARLGDGHSRLDQPPDAFLSRGYAPFLLGVIGERFVAFRPDRSTLLDAKRPFLVAIDGRPIEEWIAVVSTIASDGAPHFVREQCARHLRFLAWARQELGLEARDAVEIELCDAAGANRSKQRLSIGGTTPVFGAWPRTESRRLDGDVGYLRIPEMTGDAGALAEIAKALDGFSAARGLVIDVRGNGGGTRDVLALVAPRVLDRNDGPRVANVSKLRLTPGDDASRDDLLADRLLFKKSSSTFDDADRRAIDAVMSHFTPEWSPDERAFSDWHFLVLRPSENAKDRFRGRVAVLMDGGCFSATDVFLGALKGARGVMLVGTPSGGGSGRARVHALPASGFSVRLSSMASFRPDGRLFDGNGVEPDVLVEPAPQDFTVEGSDAQLAAAMKALKP